MACIKSPSESGIETVQLIRVRELLTLSHKLYIESEMQPIKQIR